MKEGNIIEAIKIREHDYRIIKWDIGDRFKIVEIDEKRKMLTIRSSDDKYNGYDFSITYDTYKLNFKIIREKKDVNEETNETA